MRKGVVFLYQRVFLPLFDRMVGREFERLLGVQNPTSFSVDQLGAPSLTTYVGNNVVKVNSRTDHFGVLLGGAEIPFGKRRSADFIYLYGSGIDLFKYGLLRDAERYGIPRVYVEDGFLRSVDLPFAEPGVSLLLDDESIYYDARRPSRLERLLNSDEVLSEAQLERARRLMKRLRESKVTKYNLAPIYEPQVGRADRKKVLVIDQAYQDFSIPFGLASDASFGEMLAAARREHPEKDIIVKTHPEAFRGGRKGYFTGLKQEENVFPFTDPICPYSLLEVVDEVYCVTTQMGFEALMCGKKVHCFGMPFYGGWGVTEDRVVCSRRVCERSVEEIFHFAYIEYSRYMNPETGKRCEIEEAIDYLVGLRGQAADAI
jgi:capsular polysaccharide export protein